MRRFARRVAVPLFVSLLGAATVHTVGWAEVPDSTSSTVTIRGPAAALAGGIVALDGVSQNHEASPVRPLSGLTPTVSLGHACRELASCAKANSPGVPVVVVGTQSTPVNDPVES